MLKDKKLRAEIIQSYHDISEAGHEGRQKTIELVTRNYWQPEVMRDIEQYVEWYDMYQRMKNRIEVLVRKLKLTKIPEKPWTHLTVEFITKLLLVARGDVILVVCGRLSKITHFVATTKEISAEGLVWLFRDNMGKLHGLPENIVSDKGLQFAAELMKELNQMLGIETRLSTTFHLQTDGQIECMNQKLEQYLQFFVDYRQKYWSEWLVLAEFTANNKYIW